MTLTNLQAISIIINVLVVVVVAPAARIIYRIYQNDLKHIEETLTRMERKLDEHIEWHMASQ